MVEMQTAQVNTLSLSLCSPTFHENLQQARQTTAEKIRFFAEVINAEILLIVQGLQTFSSSLYIDKL